MPRESDSLEDRKGDLIELRGNSLKKHRKYTAAWIDLGKAPTESYLYIIIELPQKGLKSVRVLEDNIVLASGRPTTYIEAAFEQYPELVVAMDELTLKLAKARVPASRELSTMFKQSLERNTRKVVKQGNKSWWFVDTSELPEEPEEDDRNL